MLRPEPSLGCTPSYFTAEGPAVRHTCARTAILPICSGCVVNTIMWRPAGFLGPQRELPRVNAMRDTTRN
jgi:hypothetical protein